MQSYQRALLIILAALLVLTGAGIVLTRNSEMGTAPLAQNKPRQGSAPVDLGQFQNAQSLAPFAANTQEQDLARDALRTADHEVDFEFTVALSAATNRPLPSTPEVKAILERISAAEKRVADLDDEVARLTKLSANAKGSQKDALAQQLDLAKARLELNEDELNDADQDLARAGGDPQSRIQQMVDEHNAANQSNNGQPDFSSVGKQASSTVPASNSFLSLARAWYAVHSFVKRLGEAEQEATAKAAAFSGRHDALEGQLEQAQSQQSKKLAESQPGGASSTSGQATAAIATYKSLTAMQQRMSTLDSRIRNQQDLATTYSQWSALAAGRERGVLHSLLISFAWMLVIALAVVLAVQFLDRLFARVEPDQKKLLTLRAVANIATRAVGAILILLVIFGLPSQMATVLALAGAGLTVALKDFIVGFFGWFVLMGKNGIRHGDWVEINGVSGEVVEIGLFHTVLLETGNWNDAGHPTGRRVTFVNSYAIEGHYFNFSTSGQWLWDELELVLPVDQDPYPVVEEIQKIVTTETDANARLAKQEWERMGSARGIRAFSAGPAISVRPANLGFEIVVRYVTRANERHQQRAKLYYAIVELLRRKNIPEPAAPPAEPSAAAAT